MKPLRIAVLGAGPIGLEAALLGRTLGHDVVVFERGDLAHNVQVWRHVRMFSPWSLNTTALGLSRLARAGCAPPPEEDCPTGAELVERYLGPLSRDPLLSGRLRLRSRVVEIGKEGLLKGDLIGKPARRKRPFRLLVEDHAGEHVEHADVVLDCSGTYGNPNAIGDGGIAAPGERWLADRLWRHIPDVLGRDRARFAGRKALVIGGGLSAATVAVAIAELGRQAPGTALLWAVRREGPVPCPPIEGDPLSGRAELMRAANDLARSGAEGAGPRAFRSGTFVEALGAEGHRLRVTLRRGQDRWSEELYDEVVGLTGYGPDNGIYRELQVHECYASRGPMKLAAALLGAGGDCLAQPDVGAEALRSPEPGFFILGAKSHGKGSAFLLQNGHRQVEQVYSLLAEA